MNIYIEFKRDRLRVKIGNEELETPIQSDFYTPVPDTESFYMFRDNATTDKLKQLVDRHRNQLGPFQKVRYWFLRNRVLVLVDNDVQKLATIGQLFGYATLFLDGRIVSIIKKPEAFDSGTLESIESIDNTAINRRGKIIGDVRISELV